MAKMKKNKVLKKINCNFTYSISTELSFLALGVFRIFINLSKESIFIRELEIARPNWHDQTFIETLTK